jgi:hypothetical protein
VRGGFLRRLGRRAGVHFGVGPRRTAARNLRLSASFHTANLTALPRNRRLRHFDLRFARGTCPHVVSSTVPSGRRPPPDFDRRRGRRPAPSNTEKTQAGRRPRRVTLKNAKTPRPHHVGARPSWWVSTAGKSGPAERHQPNSRYHPPPGLPLHLGSALRLANRSPNICAGETCGEETYTPTSCGQAT